MHELGNRIIEEFIALSLKTYSFKNYPKNTKEKGIKKHNNAKHLDYYNALRYNTQRTVDESRLQKVGDSMTTTKTSKISLNTFGEIRFYVNNIKSYPHDEILYLFKRDLTKKIRPAGSLINNTSTELDKKYNKDLLINNILELTTNDDRKLIEAKLDYIMICKAVSLMDVVICEAGSLIASLIYEAVSLIYEQTPSMVYRFIILNKNIKLVNNILYFLL